MLEVTAPGNEAALGVDFARIYRESELARREGVVVRLVVVAGTVPPLKPPAR